MAISWYESLKDIPWSKARELAPSITGRGKALWERVTARAPQPPSALEARVAELNEELVASFEVVQAMAEQHSELVRAVLGAALAAVLVLLLTLAAGA